MKTLKYILAIFFLISLTQVQAQFTLGIKGGYTMAWQDYGPNVPLPDGAETDVSRMNVAATVYYSLGKYLSLGVEPGFVQRGAACEPGFFQPFVGDTKLLLDYVQMPLMLSGHLPIWKDRMEILAKVGYGTSVIVHSEREETILNADQAPVVSRQKIQDTSFLNKWDHGAYGGLGIGVNLGKNLLFLETELYTGFRNVDRLNVSKNRTINVSMGIQRDLF